MTADHLDRALALACALSLVATPLARRFALATGFLDRPGNHKSHHRSTPYLGGVAIAAAAVTGTIVGLDTDRETLWIILVAVAMGAVGLVDDYFSLPALPRLGAQVVSAALIWGAGVRFELTGSPVADLLISLVWLVGITNAFNLLDNMDGLCAGTAALASLSLGAVALAAGQVQLALVAAAICGACLGFLPYNARRAVIFMGDAGSMFLGASVAALSLAVHPPGAASVRAAVPLLIIGLPLLDTVTVTLARHRRDIPIMQGGRDHLSHRLVARGLSTSAAVGTLLAAEAVSAAMAVLITRGVISAWIGFAVGALPLAAVWLLTCRVQVHAESVLGLAPSARWAVLGAGTVVVAISLPAGLAMLRARADIQAGTTAARAGIAKEQTGEATAAGQDFTTAAASFAAAQHHLSGWLVAAGRYAPIVAVNLRAATSLADAGLELSRDGQTLSADADAGSLHIAAGSVPLAKLATLAPKLRTVSNQLASLSSGIHGLSRTLLVGQLRRAVDTMDTKLAIAAGQSRQVADAAEVVPTVLGSEGPRRYFLAIENNAEARATGGFIGNFGELVATDGHITRGRFGRIAELNAPAGVHRQVPASADYISRYAKFSPFDLWQNVNMSPDFPTVGSVIANLYPSSGGVPVDGVIGVDPVALSDILMLTGPIHVASWPSPITSDNVVQVTLQGAYDALPNDARVSFLGDVAQAVFEALTSRDLGSAIHVALLLGPAVQQHHLQLFLTRANEQAFVSRLGAAGSVGSSPGDQLLLTTQNGAANKVDFYLHRTERYAIDLHPTGDPQSAMIANVSGSLTVDLNNAAPSSGHSSGALGPYDARFQAGENRTFFSLYTALAVRSGSLDGSALPLQSGTELGLRVYSAYVELQAATTRTLAFALTGSVPVAAGGWYTLELPRQPTLNSDRVTVTITVASGWQLQSGGTGSAWSQRAEIVTTASAPTRLRLRIRRTGPLSWLGPLPGATPPPVG